MIKKLLVLALLVLISMSSYAETIYNISTDGTDSFNAVVVSKDEKKLYVINVDGEKVKILQTFEDILTGEINGDKVVQGDKKTPEGLYFVTGFHSPEKLEGMYGKEISKMYGSGAYPLSYPNIKDRLDGKTGGGIWLHGVDPEREEDATKGCVAFKNDELVLLGEYIKTGTPVIITSMAKKGSDEDVASTYSKFKNNLENFLSAWENGDFETFKDFYHTDFKDNRGRNYSSYINQKKYLMDLFPYKLIKGSDYKFFIQDDDNAVLEFTQFYCAPNVVSYGKKKFYLESQDSKLKVVTEQFRPMDSTQYTREKINTFLLDWKKAWESISIENYIPFYSDNFRTRGMDKAAWKADKAGKFNDLQSVKVQIENIRFTIKSPTSYTVEFLQLYKGDNYSDRGIKTLHLEGCPGDFKIIAEYWRAE
jgi:murein L,D-transpeptidase YafK